MFQLLLGIAILFPELAEPRLGNDVGHLISLAFRPSDFAHASLFRKLRNKSRWDPYMPAQDIVEG